MENSRPGNHDKAWNDPPLFDFDANAGPVKPPAGKLNKRVGFPPMTSTNPYAGASAESPSTKLVDAGAKPCIEGNPCC